MGLQAGPLRATWLAAADFSSWRVNRVTGLPGSLSQLAQEVHTQSGTSPSPQPHTCSPNLNLPFPPFSDVLYGVQQLPDFTRHLDIQETKTAHHHAGSGAGTRTGVGQDAQLPAGATHRKAPPPQSKEPRLPVSSCREQRWVRPGWRGSTRPRDLCNRNTAHSCRVWCLPPAFRVPLIARHSW